MSGSDVIDGLTTIEAIAVDVLAFLYLPETRPWSFQNSSAMHRMLHAIELEPVARAMHERLLASRGIGPDGRAIPFEPVSKTKALTTSGREVVQVTSKLQRSSEDVARDAKIRKEISTRIAELNEILQVISFRSGSDMAGNETTRRACRAAKFVGIPIDL